MKYGVCTFLVLQLCLGFSQGLTKGNSSTLAPRLNWPKTNIQKIKETILETIEGPKWDKRTLIRFKRYRNLTEIHKLILTHRKSLSFKEFESILINLLIVLKEKESHQADEWPKEGPLSKENIISTLFETYFQDLDETNLRRALTLTLIHLLGVKEIDQFDEEEQQSFRRSNEAEPYTLNQSTVWLAGAQLPESNLKKVNLSGANLRKTNFKDSLFDEAILAFADLTDAELSGSSFSRTNFIRAILLRTRLRRSSFIGANLDGTNLEKAFLRNAILIHVYAQNASFLNADMMGAIVNDSDLRGALLVGIKVRTDRLYTIDLGNKENNVKKVVVADISRRTIEELRSRFGRDDDERLTEFRGSKIYVDQLREEKILCIFINEFIFDRRDPLEDQQHPILTSI